MARTTNLAVQKLLLPGGDYDGKSDLSPFVETANALVTRVDACATRKGVTLSATELELVERWLAAHCYQQSDKGYQSRSTKGKSGSFHGQWGKNLENTNYGQMALSLDPSGCLAALAQRQRAGGYWLGKAPSEQTPYDQRD